MHPCVRTCVRAGACACTCVHAWARACTRRCVWVCVCVCVSPSLSILSYISEFLDYRRVPSKQFPVHGCGDCRMRHLRFALVCTDVGGLRVDVNLAIATSAFNEIWLLSFSATKRGRPSIGSCCPRCNFPKEEFTPPAKIIAYSIHWELFHAMARARLHNFM